MALQPGWLDAWVKAHGDAPGFTYDCRANPMLAGNLKLRLDRVLARPGSGVDVTEVRMIGREPIPGGTREFSKRGGGTGSRPLLPSDHFGLVCDLSVRPAAGRRLGSAAEPPRPVEIIDLDSP